jgi:hypothetical protein
MEEFWSQCERLARLVNISGCNYEQQIPRRMLVASSVGMTNVGVARRAFQASQKNGFPSPENSGQAE